jgi:hypothetical protein
LHNTVAVTKIVVVVVVVVVVATEKVVAIISIIVNSRIGTMSVRMDVAWVDLTNVSKLKKELLLPSFYLLFIYFLTCFKFSKQRNVLFLHSVPKIISFS